MDTDYFFQMHLLKPNLTLQNVEQAVGGIGLYVNSDKTEFLRFNVDDGNSLNGKHMKVSPGSNISSTEKVAYIHMLKKMEYYCTIKNYMNI